ncbi:aldo/keto reductase [Chthonobacter albigriseus]|uniref:aldo/keto reductase n=1 Tax=Chthonobacter albigriseus TaxID=1683161 RepID=UPI0015EF4EEA|nr:aldo/keto reductase [Chthonobacter albigriseus]
MHRVELPDGTTVPAIGQGTWMMGGARERQREIRAIQAGIDLGLTLIDTAEMYGDGDAEDMVGEAIKGRRDACFLVSKVLPSNARRDAVIRSCETSLGRMGVETLDLYLLHWRGATPLAETLGAFQDLLAAGKIRRWGVSNFDLDDMQDLLALPGGDACATNQILYNPDQRGPEFDLLPWQAERRIPTMAYSPVGQGGRLLKSPALAAVARRHGVSTARVALAWAIRAGDVIAIPKASSLEHVSDNAAAADLVLTPDDLAEIEARHPAPRRKQPLAMI